MYNKKKIDKIMAKIVWRIMQAISVFSFIVLFVSVSYMIEALSVNTALFAISFACLVWIVLFSAFINNANKNRAE